MKKPTKCPRCHGPATMIDKAPRGESGDVVRCDDEAACVTRAAAKDLDAAYAAVVDAAHEFTRAVGNPGSRGGEIRIQAHLYADLRAAVTEWKDAGQALHDAVVAQGRDAA